MGDWSALTREVLAIICSRLHLIEDFVAFRGVCRWWRAAVGNDDFVKFMMAEHEGGDDREFYSLYKGKIWSKFSIPELKNKKCIESRGWFITVEGGKSGEMNLLHPFTRVQIPLPNLNTIPQYNYEDCLDDIHDQSYEFVSRAVLSASPWGTSDYVVVVITDFGQSLEFWRPGNKSWTEIEAYPTRRWLCFSDVNYCHGKFYATDFYGRIWGWEISSSTPDCTITAQVLMSTGKELLYKSVLDSYIVESAGELLLVAHMDDLGHDAANGAHETYGTTGFRVVQLDLIKCQWKEVKSLKGRSIFVGHNAAFSIDAASCGRFQGVIKPNCIYFTDNRTCSYYCTNSGQGGGRDMGLYNLDHGTIERFADIQSFSLKCPPIWISPSFS